MEWPHIPDISLGYILTSSSDCYTIHMFTDSGALYLQTWVEAENFEGKCSFEQFF